MAPSNLGDVLFNAYHRRILELLLLRQDESFHLREIGRLTGVPTGSLHRELKLLSGGGLLRERRVGNQVRYQADPDCDVLAELAAAVRKLSESRRGAHVLRARRVAEPTATYSRDLVGPAGTSSALQKLGVSKKALAALCRRHHLRKLSFFGSVTRDDFGPGSDVDVLVEFRRNHPVTLADVVELRDELSQLFGGRRVDVATRAIMNNPYRRRSIQKDLETAYVAGR